MGIENVFIEIGRKTLQRTIASGKPTAATVNLLSHPEQRMHGSVTAGGLNGN